MTEQEKQPVISDNLTKERDENQKREALRGNTPDNQSFSSEREEILDLSADAETEGSDEKLRHREPRDIIEVAESIMKGVAKPEFRKDGRLAMVTYTEKDAVIYQNGKKEIKKIKLPEFHADRMQLWLRDEMMRLCTDVSPTKAIDMWSGIKFKMPFGQVTFDNLYNSSVAWQEYKYHTEKDENGQELYVIKEKGRGKGAKYELVREEDMLKEKKEPEYKEEYEEMKGAREKRAQALNDMLSRDVYMTGKLDGFEKGFRGKRRSEDACVEGLKDIFNDNDMTRNPWGWSGFFFLNDSSNEGVDHRLKTDGKERGRAGYAAQISTLLYYNMEQILYENNNKAFFDYDKVHMENGKKFVLVSQYEKKEDEYVKTDRKKRYDLDDKGENLINPPKDILGGRMSNNLFEETLSAEVNDNIGGIEKKNLPKGQEGINTFWNSLIRQTLEGKLTSRDYQYREKEVETKDDQGKVVKQKLSDFIAEKNEKYGDWLKNDSVKNIIKDNIGELFKGDISEDKKKELLNEFLSGKSRGFAIGLLKGDKKISKDTQLNIFSSVDEPPGVIKMIRKAVEDAAAQKSGLTIQQDAKYAEFLASRQWDLMGMSARNDSGAAGFIGTSKFTNFMKYRLKSIDYRSEKNGNPYNVKDIKRLMLNPYQAFKVGREEDQEHNTTFLQMVQGSLAKDGQKEDANRVNLNAMTSFNFKGAQEEQYAGNHIANAQKLYKALTSPAGMEKLTSGCEWSNYGRPNMSNETRTFVTEQLHDIRYCFDNEGFNYDSKIQGIEYDDDGNLRFVNQTIKESMLDEKVIGVKAYDQTQTKLKAEEHVRTRRDANGKDLYHVTIGNKKETLNMDEIDVKVKEKAKSFVYVKTENNEKIFQNPETKEEGTEKKLKAKIKKEMDPKKFEEQVTEAPYRFEDKDDKKQARRVIFALLGREILRHRVEESGAEIWSREQVETIEAAYKSFLTDFSMDEDGHAESNDYMVSDHDWEEIKKFYITADNHPNKWFSIGFWEHDLVWLTIDLLKANWAVSGGLGKTVTHALK